MTIPFSNQVFLGGLFNDDLNLGDLQLSSLESNNVYVAYLKDDTWLYTEPVNQNNLSISPNPFVQSFQIETNKDYQVIEVFDISGVLIEKHLNNSISEKLGMTWESGVYMLRLVSEDGQESITKVVKIY